MRTPEEIELKLALGRSGATLLLGHPALNGQVPHRSNLANTYYDTPAGDLQAAKVALRIRQTPECTLQTLKTAGQGSGGLSSRGEWEWEISGDGLDLDGLSQLPPMQTLGRDVLDALQPRFTTDFERHAWLIEHAGASIEVALDQGEIRAGERHVAINEMELELKSGGRRSGGQRPGDSQALWQLASRLAQDVPLRPANASKAVRGATLSEGWRVGAAGASPQARFDHVITLLDALTDTQAPDFRSQARDTLILLARDAALPHSARRHVEALHEALATPDWMTAEFGQHSLALQAALHAV